MTINIEPINMLKIVHSHRNHYLVVYVEFRQDRFLIKVKDRGFDFVFVPHTHNTTQCWKGQTPLNLRLDYTNLTPYNS